MMHNNIIIIVSSCEAYTTIIVICRVTSVNRVLAQTDTSSSEFCVIQLISHINLNAARLQQILQGYWKGEEGRREEERGGEGRKVEVDLFCCVYMLLLFHVFAVMVTSFKDLKRHKHLFVTIPPILHRVWARVI